MIFQKKNKTRFVVLRNLKRSNGVKNKEKCSWKKMAKRIFFWFLLLAFFGVSFWTLFFSEVMKIQTISTESNLVKGDTVENDIRDITSGKYFDFIPKDNLLLVRKNLIEKVLRKKYRNIREIEVYRDFPSGLIVELEERESHIIWCSANECYLVDERAEPFFRLEEGESEKAMRAHVLIVDRSDKKVEIGERVTKSELVVFYEKIPDILREDARIEIEHVFEIGSYMSAELKVFTNSGWYVLLSTDRSAQTQARVLRKVLDEKITAGREDRLEYVDLRIKGKAIYKLEDGGEGDEDDREEDE